MLDSYILKDGTLVSSMDGSEKKADILVESGRITKIAEHIEKPLAEVIDAGGMYISVVWLEAHGNFAKVGEKVCINAEQDLLCQGITYALD